jgi:hypothetical protein
MAQFMNFFPRQALIGNNSASGTYYSNIFDARNVKTLLYTLEVVATSYNSSGTLVRVTLEDTEDPGMAGFGTYSGGITRTGGTGTISAEVPGDPPKRFLRAKLEHKEGQYSIVRFDVRAFC